MVHTTTPVICHVSSTLLYCILYCNHLPITFLTLFFYYSLSYRSTFANNGFEGLPQSHFTDRIRHFYYLIRRNIAVIYMYIYWYTDATHGTALKRTLTVYPQYRSREFTYYNVINCIMMIPKTFLKIKL